MILLNLETPAPQRSEKRSTVGADWFHFLSNPNTSSGEPVTEFTAMRFSTVFACVRLISQSVANAPLKLFNVSSEGRTEAVDDPLYRILRYSPNPEMSAHTFWETITADLLLSGNAYAEIGRRATGDVVALWHLPAHTCTPFRKPNGDLAYRVTATQQGTLTATRELAPKDVLHFRLWSRDGILGLSPIAQNREAIGLGVAATRFGSRFFRNYAVPSLVLQSDAEIAPEDKQRMRADWERLHSGENTHRLAVLDAGLKATPLGFSPEDAQFLGITQANKGDIANIYGVPVHLLNDATQISDNSGQTLTLNFIRFCLAGYVRRIEAEIECKLLPAPLRGSIISAVEFDLNSLLRGDPASTMSTLAVGRQWSIITANEGRKMLGMPGVGPTGDVLIAPANMVNADRLADPNYIGAPAPTSAKDAATA